MTIQPQDTLVGSPADATGPVVVPDQTPDPAAGPIPSRRYSWPADPGLANVIRDTVHRWLTTTSLGANDAASVVVAVDAAVENVIRHAYPPDQRGSVELELSTEPTAVCVSVLDHGAWRPPNPHRRPGRGITLMKSLVASVSIDVGAERGTRVELRHPLDLGAVHPAGSHGRPEGLFE